MAGSSRRGRGGGRADGSARFAAAVSAILQRVAQDAGDERRRMLEAAPEAESWFGLVRLAAAHPEVLELVLRSAGREDLATLVRERGAWSKPTNLDALMARLLARLGDGPAGACQLWATDDGLLHEALAGHDAFVRAYLQLSDHTTTDLSIGAMANLGWVAITHQVSRLATISYNARGVNPTAVQTALGWLTRNKGLLDKVCRRVDVDGQWIDTIFSTVAEATLALEEIPAVVLAAQILPWQAERLSLDSITHADMATLLRASHAIQPEPGRLPNLLIKLCLMDSAAIFCVEGDDVTLLWGGLKLGIDGPRWMGKNLLEYPDTAYVAMVRSQLQEVLREGPMLHKLEGAISGRGFAYERLAICDPPERTGVRLVVTNVAITKRFPLSAIQSDAVP